nr:MAG TPA_asm: HNH endonuclease [Caudoviricetes sp.]
MWENPSGGAPYKQRQQALKRDHHQCVKCGSAERLEVDHIKNVASGGGHNLDNLQTLCHHCHKTKTARESGAWRKKIKRQPRKPLGLA